ncbi:MAG: hypothetical protein ACRCZC_07330, partial [Culicoidibacterales bacterium]
ESEPTILGGKNMSKIQTNVKMKIKYLTMLFAEQEITGLQKQKLNNEFYLLAIPGHYLPAMPAAKLFLCCNDYDSLVPDFSYMEVIDVSSLVYDIERLSEFIRTHITTYYQLQLMQLSSMED